VIERLYRFEGDGWWPRLSPDAEAVCFGNLESRAWHIGGGVWPAVTGRQSRFIRPGVVTFTFELDPQHAQRWERDLRTGALTLMADDPALVAGNDFDAANGSWASVISGGRLCIDGVVHAGRYGGLQMAGDLVVAVQDQTRYAVFERGISRPPRPCPDRANNFRMTLPGLITSGYFWDSTLLHVPSGLVDDITLTPWRREGPPVLVDVDGATWAWTFTETPSGRLAVVGMPLRPWHQQDFHAVALPDWDASSWLEVRWDPRRRHFLLAGSSDRGALEVWTVSIDHPLTDLRTWGVVDPPPPPHRPLLRRKT
jgi:hypothetical protein